VPGFDQTTPINAGRTLGGRYRLEVPIARGGMAEVWEAHDEILSRPVAVKVLQPHLATDDIFLERFRREAVTAARLAHPGVVSTFDTGIDNGTAYIVMELVKGRTLRQLLTEQRRLEPWQAVAVARQIADALVHAHQAGLVHRDIKPANVLLVEDEMGGMRVKVTDFGIAKASAGIGTDLTRTGTVLGTPKYVSPEQIKGEDPDARADLYSLGIVFYEMLVGSPPFVGDTDLATAMAHLNNRVPKVSASVRGVPPELDRLVADLLAKDPKRRVPSAVVLRQRLDALGPLSPSVGGVRPAGRDNRHVPVPGARGRGRRIDPGPTYLPPPPPQPGLRPVDGDGTVRVPRSVGASGTANTVVYPTVPRVVPGPPAPPRPRPTDELDTVARGGFRRTGRVAGAVVAGLILVGAIFAAVLVFSTSGSSPPSSPSTAPAHATAAHISSVNVFMNNNRPPDNPAEAKLTIDGNPATFWSTDKYPNSTFGHLYSGIGLAMDLAQSTKLHTLTVTSRSNGWAGEVFVSATPVATGQPLSDWGPPVAIHTDVAGSTSFTLGGRRGQYVLFWLTNLGPADQTVIYELTVS
jgi:eukaryotic-like serine/threonine-protein kinase